MGIGIILICIKCTEIVHVISIMAFIGEQKRTEIIQRVLKARAERARFLEVMKSRQTEGWSIAHQSAQKLKDDFGVDRVILFGSMLDHKRMTEHSDIDLAVQGLAKEDFLRAGAAIERGQNFKIDLINIETAPKYLEEAIERGTEL